MPSSRRHVIRTLAALGATWLTSAALQAQAPAPVTLLNVSYDPTRELYV